MTLLSTTHQVHFLSLYEYGMVGKKQKKKHTVFGSLTPLSKRGTINTQFHYMK
jgi:hypothetical protein